MTTFTHHAQARVRYLEDLQPGERFTSSTHLVDAAEIKAFASQFDPQPFHTDEMIAPATFFGGLAASGWHTAAITMRLLVTGPVVMAGGIIGAGAEVSWPQATRPGDLLQVESEIVEVTPSRSRPDRGIAVLQSYTRNQHGEVVQQMRAKLLVFRRPVDADTID
jgi:acyl dehydratase